MPIVGSEYEILGVTIVNVGLISRPVHIVFGDSVTALYGLNGSGKTQILKTVVAALKGRTPLDIDRFALDVHVRLHDRISDAGGRATPLVRYLGRCAEREDDLTKPREVLQEALRLTLDRSSGSISEGSAVKNQVEARAAIEEGARRGLLTLSATSAFYSEVPDWTLRFSVARDSKLTTEWLEGVEGSIDDLQEGRREAIREIEGVDPNYVSFAGPNPESRRWRILPDGIPVPTTFSLGQLSSGSPSWQGDPIPQPLVEVCGDHASEPDVHSATRLFVLDQADLLMLDSDDVFDGTGDLDPDLRAEVDLLASTCSRLLSIALPHTRMRLVLGNPSRWFRGELSRWLIGDQDLDDASGAQQRWAFIAFCLARLMACNESGAGSRAAPRLPRLLVCDEPEAGLHRALEHDLPTTLRRLGEAADASVLVATHSPSILSSPLVDTRFVSRGHDGEVSVRTVDVSVRDSAAVKASASALGMRAGDLWSHSRVVVVVEGVHDEWVFSQLLRDEVDRAMVGFLPIHGGTRLRSLADARAVMVGTDAKILVVLDDLNDSEVRAYYDRLRSAEPGAERDRILDEMRIRGRDNDSLLFVHQFAVEGAKIDCLDRVEFLGMSRPDVICYLDPGMLLGTESTWDELIDEWRSEAGERGARNIKRWLAQRSLLSSVPEAVNEAVEAVGLTMRVEGYPLHQDLVRLSSRILELSLHE